MFFVSFFFFVWGKKRLKNDSTGKNVDDTKLFVVLLSISVRSERHKYWIRNGSGETSLWTLMEMYRVGSWPASTRPHHRNQLKSLPLLHSVVVSLKLKLKNSMIPETLHWPGTCLLKRLQFDGATLKSSIDESSRWMSCNWCHCSCLWMKY